MEGHAQAPTIDVWNVSSSICNACLDGVYENCYCNSMDQPSFKSLQIRKELSNDSLDQCSITDSPYNRRKQLNSSGTYSFNGEYISDNEFEDGFVTDNRQLLTSMTDWDTIDSVLSDELLSEDHNTSVSSRFTQGGGPMMQMVFVDSESDKESIPDVEVYYDDNQDFLNNSSSSRCGSERNVESRDSGYVTGDIYELNIEHVTDDKRRSSLEPAEEASRVLASLHLHEECEQKHRRELEEKKQKEYDYCSKLYSKNIEELFILKESLEMRVAEINMELVQELSSRDELYSHHQALLMDADDIAKSSHQSDNTPTNSPSKKAVSPKTKRRSFWWR